METVNFASMNFFDSLVKIAGQIYDFLHFKGCSYLNHKTSFNLSVQVATFLVFDNPFMMLLDIFMPVLDHALMLDNFLITRSSVYLNGTPKPRVRRHYCIVTLSFT